MTAVVIEAGKKRAFASALGWPGWCRSGRDEAAALEALAAYAGRYAPIARAAGLKPPGTDFEVVERLAGDATTEFGAPSQPAAAERGPVSAADAERAVALLEAAWTAFEKVVARAPGELRKGPRGGGRDRDQIVAHVVEAQRAYLPKIGVRTKGPAAEVRAVAVEAIRAGSDDAKWPRLYAARRMAWHVLDHAWEIEDRSPQ